jgi:hypothetical protein
MWSAFAPVKRAARHCDEFGSVNSVRRFPALASVALALLAGTTIGVAGARTFAAADRHAQHAVELGVAAPTALSVAATPGPRPPSSPVPLGTLAAGALLVAAAAVERATRSRAAVSASRRASA